MRRPDNKNDNLFPWQLLMWIILRKSLIHPSLSMFPPMKTYYSCCHQVFSSRDFFDNFRWDGIFKISCNVNIFVNSARLRQHPGASSTSRSIYELGKVTYLSNINDRPNLINFLNLKYCSLNLITLSDNELCIECVKIIHRRWNENNLNNEENK